VLRSSFGQFTSDLVPFISVLAILSVAQCYFQALLLETGSIQGQNTVAGIDVKWFDCSLVDGISVISFLVSCICSLLSIPSWHIIVAGTLVCCQRMELGFLLVPCLDTTPKYQCLHLCRIHVCARLEPCLCSKCSCPFTAVRKFDLVISSHLKTSFMPQYAFMPIHEVDIGFHCFCS